MSKLEIVSREDSKFNDGLRLEQEVTPKPQVLPKKEGRIKRIVAHLIGPDGFKAVVMNTIDQQIKPSLQNLAGSCIRMVFEGIQRTVFDLIFGIGEGERMMRNSGGYGGFGFSGTGFRFNGGANRFHGGVNTNVTNSQWDRSLSDSQRTQARDDLYRRNARQPLREYFDSYEQAMDLLNRLGGHAATLGYLTVANYHELCGRDTTERERDFGWYLEDVQNLASIEHDSRNGYYVSLPPTTTLRR